MSDETPRSRPDFPETRWTRILAVQEGAGTSPEADRALEELCGAYWRPVYRHCRRNGLPPEEAEDATQGFFAEVLSRRAFSRADPKRGRFRSFLLGACRRFLAERTRNGARLKRGGGVVACPLDELPEGEEFERAEESGWDEHFDSAWAYEVVQRVLVQLRGEYQERGQEGLLAQFEWELGSRTEPQWLPGHGPESPGLTRGAARVAVFRLRQRFRRLLATEVRNTVASDAEAEDELRHLYRAYTTGPRSAVV